MSTETGAPGATSAAMADSTSCRFSSSLLMSMRQPSSFAARRTFCPFFPMASESCESYDDFHMLAQRIDDRNPADLGRAQRMRGEHHVVVGILDDIDLFAAQLADDGLHAHSLHTHAGADAVHVPVPALHGDLG